jgi:hypothetical protein
MKLIAAACVLDTGGSNFIAVSMITMINNDGQYQLAYTCAVLKKNKNFLFKIVGIILRPIYGKIRPLSKKFALPPF